MNFKTVAIDDYPILKPFFTDLPYNLSIYSPASIIAWSNEGHTAAYALADKTLYISGHKDGTPGTHYLILPLGKNRPDTPSDLQRLARELGFERYWYVPEDFLASLNWNDLENRFRIEEQLGFEDYVYLTEDLTQLKGNRFHKKKNLLHQFTREYVARNRAIVEPIGTGDVQPCLDFIDQWCERHPCEVDRVQDLACEIDAVKTTLSHLEKLESKGILVRIDGAIVALGIGSRLNDRTATLNFEKAFPDIKGLYQFLDNECAKRLFSSYLYINKESDMNLPSLAEAKQSYNPVLRVKSFELILR